MSVRPKTLLYKSIILLMAFSLLGVTLALAASGDLDPTFSGNGWVVTDFNRQEDHLNEIAIQPDGKIVAAGSSVNVLQGAGNFALARYTPDGKLDRTFSGNGWVQTNFGGDDGASGVVLQADGKIVLAGGICRQSGYCHGALARYTPDGTLDPTFGGDGKVVATNFGGFFDVALQPDGKIVVCGYAHPQESSFLDNNLVVYRYLPDGSLDLTFSGDGKVRIRIPGSIASALAIQPGDGKIVAVGWLVVDYLQDDVVVVRLTPDGALDTTFNGNGIQRTDFHLGGGDDAAYAVAIQPNGKIVVAGETSDVFEAYPENTAVARYNANGTLDTTFSGDGQLLLDFGDLTESAAGVAVDPDGKLVLAIDSSDPLLVRLKPNGAFDRSFHGEGFVAIPFPRTVRPMSLARQSSDGKYVIGGWLYSRGWETDFLVVRVLP